MKKGGLTPVVGDFVLPWAPFGPPLGPRGPPSVLVGSRRLPSSRVGWPPFGLPSARFGPPSAPVGFRRPASASVGPRQPLLGTVMLRFVGDAGDGHHIGGGQGHGGEYAG